jgi:hypothetical protein
VRRGFEVLKDDLRAVTLRGEALELAGIKFWTRRASEIYERRREEFQGHRPAAGP